MNNVCLHVYCYVLLLFLLYHNYITSYKLDRTWCVPVLSKTQLTFFFARDKNKTTIKSSQMKDKTKQAKYFISREIEVYKKYEPRQ